MGRDSIRIADFRGLDGRRYAEEAQASQSTRGGFNVQLVDGELWTRLGHPFLAGTRMNKASIPWWWVVEIPDDTNDVALCSPWYAVKLRISGASAGQVDSLYSPVVTENVAVTNGNAVVTTTSTRSIGDLMLRGAGLTDIVHRVVDVSGTSATLDRAYAGATGAAVSHRFYTPILVPGSTPDPTSPSGEAKAGCCVFDQLVTHTGSSLGYANPAVTAGRRYLVITSEGADPVAIDLDGTAALKTDIFRDTSLASPDAIPTSARRGPVCCVWDDRLVIGGAPDKRGDFGDRTIWLSQRGDLLRWHDGLQGSTGNPQYKTFVGNHDEIRGLGVLGGALIVHREYSQETGFAVAASPPIQFTSNAQGMGLRTTRSLVIADRLHYFWSDQGPCVFDGQAVQRFGQEIDSHLEGMSMFDTIGFGMHDREAQRICWISEQTLRHQDASVPAQGTTVVSGSSEETYAHVRPMVVYDYRQGAWWFEDHVAIHGAGIARGGKTYAVRFDGNILDWHPSAETGVDPGVTTGTNVVDAQVELPWMNLGSLLQKKITQIHVELRALDTTDGGGPDAVDDLWTLTTETLHFATLVIYADGERTTAAWTSNAGDMDKVVSAMLALELDENRQLPLMVNKLSPKASAQEFKLVLKNALAATSPGSTYTKGHFRLAGIEVFFDTGTSDRRTKPFNRG